MPRRDGDIVIVGAGAVGAALALALARAGRRITIVDGRSGPAAAPGDEYGEFVVSLNLASIAFLRAIGVWPAIHASRVSPYGGMLLWDEGGAGATHFDSVDVGEPALGCFVEAALLEARLHEALAEYPGVTRRWGRRATGLQRAHDGARLTLDDGDTVQAGLVIGADGGRSAMRQLADIGVERLDYGQRAIVCNFATERDHGAIARQRFMQGGPVAMLPLADGRCSLAWFRPEPEAERLVELDDESFMQSLSEATDYALGAVTGATRRRAFPIVRRHAARYVAERFALVGDAAHTIHPQAGQGLNLGLMDAAALAEVVGGQAERGFRQVDDPGADRVLRYYARWRRGHNTAVMHAMDAFHHGFARPIPLPGALRGLGLAAADRAGPAKRLILRHGAGLAGDLPRCARPVGGYGIGP
jgi:ubiquinone biosynthesis UbiH/UbiF/VisC/COQ6 family hydroxylase